MPDPQTTAVPRTATRLLGAVTALAVAIGLVAATPPAQATDQTDDVAPTGIPQVISSLGDSISEGTGATGAGEGGWPGSARPANSWTTGDWPGLDSHAQRLEALGAEVVREPRSANGARMATDAVNQAMALPIDVDYVTVQLGGNDLCRPTVEEMTPTDTYAAELDAALTWIGQNRPDALVGVSSVPDIYRLWDIRKSNWVAVLFWASGLIPCQSLLASPLSSAPEDQARRDAVRARSLEYNAAIETVCATHANCRSDANAVWDFTNDPAVFVDADISTQDHFHPSYGGQQKLADISWGTTWEFPADAPAATSATTDLPAPVAAPAPVPDLPVAASWRLGVRAADTTEAAEAARDDVARAGATDLAGYRAVVRAAVPALVEVPDALVDDLPTTACTIAAADADGLAEAVAELVASDLIDADVAAYLVAAAAAVGCPAAGDIVDDALR